MTRFMSCLLALCCLVGNVLSLHIVFSGVHLRRALSSAVVGAGCLVGSTTLLMPPVAPCYAANLPESNGATGNKRGTKEALMPILEMQKVAEAAAALRGGGDLAKIQKLLSSPVLPKSERSFKKLFDEFSLDVSYKQQYLDKNAFVVYYTRGFDGPGRANIEESTPEEDLQKEQYYQRNEAWLALDDARSEVDYLLERPAEARGDLDAALSRLQASVDNFVGLVPLE